MTEQATQPREPSPREVRRWRQYLADERAEASVYRGLAAHRGGEEREILLELAEAESRHEAHWIELLGDRAGRPRRPALRSILLGLLARRFGSVFVLALVQRAEARSPYDDDRAATAAMAADERIHEEVVRGLAARGRQRLSGTFRAAVFGANDGLVSNLSLLAGISASGVDNHVVLLTGLAGLLSGALSMGAGEYVSVRSQRELLEASSPDPEADRAVPALDLDANELALVYRARGLSAEDADREAQAVLHHPASGLGRVDEAPPGPTGADAGPGAEVVDEHEAVGTGLGAATSSFAFFASGAAIPVLPFLLGAEGLTGVVIAAVLVGLSLLLTGAAVGILSGASPLRRGLRQLAIGYGAAAVTYLLGLLLGTGGAG